MKKLFSFLAAALLTLSANATVREITPTHCFEGERTDGYTLYVELARGAQAGDTIVLADGTYLEGQSIPVNNDVTIMAAEDAHPVVQMSGYFKIHASAIFKGIKFKSVAAAGSGYCTYFYDNSHKYVKFEDCEFQDFMDYVASSWEAYHIDSCIVNNCYFHDLGKAPFYFAKSTLENDVNACDKLVVTNCTFANIALTDVAVLDLRNNNNSTAATSTLIADHCTFYNCSGYERMLQAYKSPLFYVTNCIMANEEEAAIYATYAYGGEVNNCLTYNNSGHRNWAPAPTLTNNIVGNPLFVDAAAGDLHLGEGSPALNASTDGTHLGDPRWWPAAAPAVEDGFYIIYADWNLESLGAKLAVNPEAQDGADEMFVSFNLPEGFALKVVEVANGNIVGWYPNDYGTEYVADAAHSGDVVLYFRKNYDGDSNYWYSGCIYIDVPQSPQPAEDVILVDFQESIGVFEIGGNAEINSTKQKYDANAVTPDKVLSFGSNLYVKNDANEQIATNYIKISPVEGGFLAGDIVRFAPYFNNSATDGSKYANIGFFDVNEDANAAIYSTTDGITNGYYVEGVPPTIEFTLTAATDYMLVGRVNAKSRANILSLQVIRPASVPSAVENAAAVVKAVKVLENGRVLIIRDGIRYTVLGQRQ